MLEGPITALLEGPLERGTCILLQTPAPLDVLMVHASGLIHSGLIHSGLPTRLGRWPIAPC